MSKRNSQRGVVVWAILLLAVLLVACYEATGVTEPPERSQPTQDQQAGMQPTEWVPRQVEEEGIDFSTVIACRDIDVGTLPSYDQLELEEFGISLEYPPGWYFETFDPLEWIGSGDPGPEYLAAFSNVPQNFDPGYSKGSGQYNDQTGIAQVFVYRWPKDPNQNIYRATGVNPSDPDVFQLKKEDYGLEGFFIVDRWDDNSDELWTTFYAEYDLGGYGLTIEAKVWRSEFELYKHCLFEANIVFPILLTP